MEIVVEVDEFTADVPIPEDLVDNVDATTVVQAAQALANRTKYLNARLGAMWMVDSTGVTDATTGTLLANDSEATYQDTTKVELASFTTLAGDVIEIDLFGSVDADADSAQMFRLSTTLDTGTAPTAVSGAEAIFDALDAETRPLALLGVVTSASAGVTHVWLQSSSPGGVSEGYFRGPYNVRARQYRSTT